MIEEHGTIVDIKDNRVAIVQCGRSSACQHCPSMDSCHMGEDKETMLIEAVNEVDAKLHDRVKVVTSTRNFLQSSFMLYIIPVLALLVGALVGQYFGEQSQSIDPSLVSALLGSFCLVVSFFGIRLLTRKLQKEAYMPRIIAIES